MAYLLDSGFLYGFIDEADEHHEAVSAIFGKIREPIILPVPTITEIAYFVSKNLGVGALANFLDEISETDFILETPTAEDYQRAAEILRKYNDANIDFVDACIVSIAERLNVTKILTVDRRHFGAFKPRHCEAFEILP
jgi:uncharacterized protein